MRTLVISDQSWTVQADEDSQVEATEELTTDTESELSFSYARI